jgi:spermidine synthase
MKVGRRALRTHRYDGDVIFSCRDADGVIDVVDEIAVRSLQFSSAARQSTMFRQEPNRLALAYTQCMMTCLLFGDAPERVLMLGLGGGSLVKFLLDQCSDCRVDAVEKRPKIVEVAREYFHLPQDQRLSVHVEDALQFLEAPRTDLYDLIAVDLHDSHGMAPVVQRTEFFPCCHNWLAADGMLVINLWYGSNESEERMVRDNLVEVFKGRVLYLPVAGKRNCIALIFGTSRDLDVAAARARARQWQQRTQIDFPALLSEMRRFNPVFQ